MYVMTCQVYTIRCVRAKKVYVYKSKEALSPFFLSPLEFHLIKMYVSLSLHV